MIRNLLLLATLCVSPAVAGEFCVSSQLSTDAVPTAYCKTITDAVPTVYCKTITYAVPTEYCKTMLLPQGMINTPASADLKASDEALDAKDDARGVFR